MKSKILLFSILVSFLFVVSSAYAGTLTVSLANALSSKSLAENEQITVTVTVSNPSGTETDIITTLSSSTSWFSIVTACSNIASLSAGASGTSICIIKPTSTGADLTLTAKSEPQNDATKAGTDSTSGINVASQSSALTASISAPSSVGTSATFYVGTTVVAPSANDVVNARTTISASGQCEVDTTDVSASQSLGNITKGTTKSSLNWKLISSSGSGTCSVTVNVVSDVGGSASPSKSITVGTPSAGDGGGAVAGGAAGGVAGGAVTAKPKVLVGEKEAIITIESIATKSEVNFSIDSKVVAITAMKIRATNTVSNVKITITKIDARPRDVVSDVPGVVNQYLNIDKVNITAGDIGNVTMDFKVDRNWISSNNINESTVVLYRYGSDDQWKRLETVKISEDVANIYYQAISPGLSVFAITGETKAVPIAPPSEQPQVEEKKPVEEFVKSLKKDSWKIVIIIVGVALTVTVIYLMKTHFSKSKTQVRRK